MSSLQSVSLPGRTATPLPFFFFDFLTERIRALCLTDSEFGDFCRSPRFGSALNSSGRPDTAATSFQRLSRIWSVRLWSDLGTAGRGRGGEDEGGFARTHRRFALLRRTVGGW